MQVPTSPEATLEIMVYDMSEALHGRSLGALTFTLAGLISNYEQGVTSNLFLRAHAHTRARTHARTHAQSPHSPLILTFYYSDAPL